MQRALARIAEATSQETAAALYRWGIEEFLYGGREVGDAYMWGSLLSRLAGVYEEPIESPSLPAEKVEALKQAVREYLGESYWQLREGLDELVQRPKSSWDENLHRTAQADHPDIPDELGPLSSLLIYIHNRRLRKLWQRIKSLLMPQELEALIEWAKAETHKQRTSDLGSPPGGW